MQERSDFPQREPEVFQGQNAVQTRQLIERVVAVPAPIIDIGWLEQADLIVMPQGFDRDFAEAGEDANTYHQHLLVWIVNGFKERIHPPVGGESDRQQQTMQFGK